MTACPKIYFSMRNSSALFVLSFIAPIANSRNDSAVMSGVNAQNALPQVHARVYQVFKDAMSMTKPYFTSLSNKRS
jgi:hypothetical protein